MSEKYRQALRDGDHVAAGRAIMEAVQGNYDSRAVHGLHGVVRMSQEERNAPDLDDDNDASQVTVVQVNNSFFGRLRGRR